MIALIASGAFSQRSGIQSDQHWLKIVNIRLGEERFASQLTSVRILAEVNGYGLSYPTRALWARPGPDMSSEV